MSEDLISRQAAIDLMLAALDDDWESDYAKDRTCELPSAQENLQPTCNQLATDCISRQAAIDVIKEFQHGAAEWRDEQEERSDIWHRADSAVASAIEIKLRVKKLPSAQTEIVRCRECKHHDGIRCFRWNSTIITGFDDFCSNGERRSEDDH